MSDSRLDNELKFSMNFNFCETPSQLSSGYAKTAKFASSFPDVYNVIFFLQAYNGNTFATGNA